MGQLAMARVLPHSWSITNRLHTTVWTDQCGTQSYQLHHFQAPCSMLKFDSQKLELATFTDCRSFQWSITAWTDWSALPAFYLARFTSWIILARTETVFFAPQHWRNNGAVEKGPPMACPKTEPRSIGCVWDFGTMWDIPRNAWHLVACDDQFLLFWDITATYFGYGSSNWASTDAFGVWFGSSLWPGHGPYPQEFRNLLTLIWIRAELKVRHAGENSAAEGVDPAISHNCFFRENLQGKKIVAKGKKQTCNSGLL